MLQKIKIVVVGAPNTGKSLLSNIVSGHMTDATLLQEHARPTTGVRILEFEHELANKSNVDVELWDTSGDTNQEQLWTAFAAEIAGVVILARESNIESYVDYFVEGSKLQSEQSLLWLNSEEAHPINKSSIGSIITHDIISDLQSTKSKFATFLDQCARVEKENQERDERRIAA